MPWGLEAPRTLCCAASHGSHGTEQGMGEMLSTGAALPPGHISLRLQTFLVVTTGGCYWHLVAGRGQEHRSVSHSAQGARGAGKRSSPRCPVSTLGKLDLQEPRDPSSFNETHGNSRPSPQWPPETTELTVRSRF